MEIDQLNVELLVVWKSTVQVIFPAGRATIRFVCLSITALGFRANSRSFDSLDRPHTHAQLCPMSPPLPLSLLFGHNRFNVGVDIIRKGKSKTKPIASSTRHSLFLSFLANS